MKRTLFTVMIALAVLTGAYSIAGAADGVHTNYRPGYSGGCGGSAACHSISPVTFLPTPLGTTPAPTEDDYTNFCLACHNAAGEAHSKSAGAPSSNIYRGSTTIQGNSGDSHSWNGKNHNAGTRTPTSANFVKSVDGSDFMVGTDKRVTCQTCHDAMRKTTGYNTTQNIESWAPATLQSGNSYTFGYANTSQYLGQYIKVYRSASAVTRPSPDTETRSKKQYLVDPSEYTYNYSNGTITFNTSQGSNYIYVEIPQPYLRVDNTANAICVDCHNNRLSSGVSHAPGTGATNGHPVAVNYGHSSGLNDTLKSSATGNVYLEVVAGNSQVLCTSCHDPHNAVSKNGQIMREADDQTLCGDCHKTKLSGYSTAGSVNIHNGSKHSSPTVCVDCHTTHDSNNIMLIKNVINGKTINFRNFSGANSFGNQNGTSICEACHSATTYHKSDGTGTTHNTGKNCLGCHKHEKGFDAGISCSACHGDPPGPTTAPSGWTLEADDVEHGTHMTNILNKFGLTGHDACVRCHGTVPRSDHNLGKTTAGIDTSTWGIGTFSDGGTIGTISRTDDTCSNVTCHTGGDTSGTRNWKAGGCDSCHPYPGSATNDWANYNGHVVRSDTNALTHMLATGYNAATDTYAAMVADPTRCGKCHPNVPSNHQNGAINLSPSAYACGGGNITINQTVTRSNVTCDAAVCHNTRTTPNWW